MESEGKRVRKKKKCTCCPVHHKHGTLRQRAWRWVKKNWLSLLLLLLVLWSLRHEISMLASEIWLLELTEKLAWIRTMAEYLLLGRHIRV